MTTVNYTRRHLLTYTPTPILYLYHAVMHGDGCVTSTSQIIHSQPREGKNLISSYYTGRSTRLAEVYFLQNVSRMLILLQGKRDIVCIHLS